VTAPKLEGTHGTRSMAYNCIILYVTAYIYMHVAGIYLYKGIGIRKHLFFVSGTGRSDV
jgi:hypothetical protein